MEFAIYTLIACTLLAFGGFAYTRGRLGRVDRALGDLDWEAVARRVGEVAVIKRRMQKVIMRQDAMETADPMAALAKLPQLQQNVTPIAAAKKRGG